MSRPPEWLQELANQLALRMMPTDLMAPIGCHFCQVDGQWEITLFAQRSEVIGGRRDGVRQPSKFSVDVLEIRDLFSVVNDLHWQALSLGAGDDLGAHLSVEGEYQGHAVWVRILSAAPHRLSGR